MMFEHRFEVSDDFIKVMQSDRYEEFVLSVMNVSDKIFPNKYIKVEEQSHGECDFVDAVTGEKFDAKLPFEQQQVKMLTNGKSHAPKIKEWIQELQEESSEFQPLEVRNGNCVVSELKLYSIMEKAILRDKEDENIIFFFPFPIVTSVRGAIFLQFASNYLDAIFNELKNICDFSKRSVYVIYPSSEKKVFAVRNLKETYMEYVKSTYFDKYFTHEIIEVKEQ